MKSHGRNSPSRDAGPPSASNAAKVFAIKGRISRFSANAVDAVPIEAVDESVVQFAGS
jgi:hypothetical protein